MPVQKQKEGTVIPRKTARERILEVATDLFYREGIRAVGVDTIVAKSGVAKMSLYRSFPSKDDLVAAFLEEKNQRFWEWWDGVVTPEKSPREQLKALFAAGNEKTTKADYRGCPFINTATEFPESDHPGRKVALAHQQELRARLLELSEDPRASRPAMLADQLLLLLNGAFSTAGTLRGTVPISSALSEAVEVLIVAHLYS